MSNTYWQDKLAELVGAKIISVAVDDESSYTRDEPFVGIVVQFKGGTKKVCWLLSDEEGNDVGRFTIEDFKD